MRSTELQPSDAPVEDHRDRILDARDLTLGGLFGALGIAVPMVFHALGPGMGPVWLPMYLPILALGLLASWRTALVVGLATPIMSAVLTGMPPLVPMAPLMALELGALGTCASLCRQAGVGIVAASVMAIVATRIVGVLALVTIGRAMGMQQPVVAYALLSLAVAWPGILLQLTVVPAAAYAVERTSILGPRWKRDLH